MAYDNVPRLNSFSLGDFHNAEKCFFDFLVKHHLQKRYEIEDGNKNLTIGSVLDLVMKIIHRSKAYDQPLDYILTAIFSAAEREIRTSVEKKGPQSFYGATAKFLNEENINIAKEVFKNYYLKRGGKINKSIVGEKFWDLLLEGEEVLKLWGGPDSLEIGTDGVPEVVDYKYFEDVEKGKNYLDMDTMPKLYILLCASELQKLGYEKARFRVRSWSDPLDESLYEEFDLETVANLKDFFKYKIQQIMSIKEINFCERDYCKSCKSDQREVWVDELRLKYNFS